jgi:hypothetical protein
MSRPNPRVREAFVEVVEDVYCQGPEVPRLSFQVPRKPDQHQSCGCDGGGSKRLFRKWSRTVVVSPMTSPARDRSDRRTQISRGASMPERDGEVPYIR